MFFIERNPKDNEQQYRPYEHIPIGGRVCFVGDSHFIPGGCVLKGYYGTRVQRNEAGVYIAWDYLPGAIVHHYRRVLRYPVLNDKIN